MCLKFSWPLIVRIAFSHECPGKGGVLIELREVYWGLISFLLA